MEGTDMITARDPNVLKIATQLGSTILVFRNGGPLGTIRWTLSRFRDVELPPLPSLRIKRSHCNSKRLHSWSGVSSIWHFSHRFFSSNWWALSTAIVLALRNYSSYASELCNLSFLSFLAEMCNFAVVQQKCRTYVNIGSKLGQYVFRFEKIIYATKGMGMTADAYRIVCSVWVWQHSINIYTRTHTSDNDNTRYARSMWSTFICDSRIVCMYERN